MKIKLFFLFIFCFTVFPEGINFLGNNIVKNPGFEKGNLFFWNFSHSKKGTEVIIDSSVKLKGNNSLLLKLTESPSNVSVSSDFIPVENKTYYLFSISFRQKWAGAGRDKYVGISSFATVEWFNKEKKFIDRAKSISRFPYGPSGWDIRDALLLSPPGSSYAKIKINISNSSLKTMRKIIPAYLWVDCVQLRKYTPLPLPDWAKVKIPAALDGFTSKYFIKQFFPATDEGFRGKGSKWFKIVEDNQSNNGKVIFVPAGAGKGMVTHSPYFSSIPSGLYRLQIKARISENSGKNEIGYLDITTQFSGIRLLLNFYPYMFGQKNRYCTFQRDFIIRDNGWWAIRIYTTGKENWYIDGIKITLLKELSDTQMLDIYPGIAGEIPPDLKIRENASLKILLFAGIGYNRCFSEKIFKFIDKNAIIKKVWAKKGRSMQFENLPENVGEFFDNNCIILFNVSISGLSLRIKNYIKEYVKRGGKVIIFGGQSAYERDGWKKSLLENILPFEILDKTQGSISYSKNGYLLKKSDWFKWNIPFSENPVVFFIHRIKKIKETGEVLIFADNFPFLIKGNYGKGKVYCFLGTPFGKGKNNIVPYWNWDKWEQLISLIIREE